MAEEKRGTKVGYRVEARALDPENGMIPLHDGLLGPEWREVRFPARQADEWLEILDFGQGMPLETAASRAWNLVGEAAGRLLECRIVEYTVEYSYKVERMGVVDGLGIARRFLPLPE